MHQFVSAPGKQDERILTKTKLDRQATYMRSGFLRRPFPEAKSVTERRAEICRLRARLRGAAAVVF